MIHSMRRIGLLVIVLWSAAVFAGEPDWHVRSGAANAAWALRQCEPGLSYVYFIASGASAGKGHSKDVKGWVHTVMACLPELTGNPKPVLCPYGCNSWRARFFYSRGGSIWNGRLHFHDFSYADVKTDPAVVARNEEALVRAQRRFRPSNTHVFVYTLTEPMFSAYRKGETPSYIAAMERVADQYGIPSVNLAKAAAEKIISGELKEDDFLGKLNRDSAPGDRQTDAGAKFYNETMTAFLKALLAAKPAVEKLVDHAPVAKLDPLCDDRGCTVDYESLILRKHGDWEPGTPTGLRGRPNHMLLGSHVGDELLLPFKGSEIGAVFVWDEKPATLTCTVDGGAAKTVAPRPAKPGKPYLDTTPLFEGLDPEKEHELKIRITGEGKVGLTCLLLNGEIAKVDFGAKGTLPGIDAIYKTMKPIAYEPPADRFKLLPKTMKTLREGGTLRMVLLGDSIIGNLSSSSFELLMMRDHPKAKVDKIVSIRGGTGCNWYCKENRVKKYVLDLKPDLLVIGGISNGEDPECVRSVVRQVRAALPDLEILITTPVFGALSEQRIAWFDADIEKTKGSFRHGLKGVAADEKCAFFDMTGPWWQYLSTSGKAPGYFMGDAVHANARGSQLIGRLFARWFQD